MGVSYTREQLEEKTCKELKRMCIDELGITGVSKKVKDIVIDAILDKYESETEAPMSGVAFSGHSVMTKPDAEFGSRTTTTIHVSCGASSGNFPVVGRSVRQVGEFLREVLNVDQLSTGLVNGKEVDAEYILQQGDNLEFLKPAGKKGC